MVAVLGPLIGRVPLHALQAVVGILLLLFGLRWLRKAILRSIGIIALHDEDEAFARETRELAGADHKRASGLDWIACMTSFKAVLLEGVEVVFIVIAVGVGGLLWLASAGALAACVLVAAIGAAALGPLSQVPALLRARGRPLACRRVLAPDRLDQFQRFLWDAGFLPHLH